MISAFEFGQNISKARSSCGLTQKEVASDLGCYQSTISRIEKGEHVDNPLFNYLIYLKGLGVDLNDVFSPGKEK